MSKGKTKVRFGSGVDFSLTLEGKKRAEEMGPSNSESFVLIFLDTFGPCSLSAIYNISSETKFSDAELKQAIQRLIANGLVTTVRSDNNNE
jgi:hypothetical protein